jgi:hypothetical protein
MELLISDNLNVKVLTGLLAGSVATRNNKHTIQI